MQREDSFYTAESDFQYQDQQLQYSLERVTRQRDQLEEDKRILKRRLHDLFFQHQEIMLLIINVIDLSLSRG